MPPEFGPIGNSAIISLTTASQALALGTLASSNPAIRLISLNALQLAWYLKFGTSGAVTVSASDGMRVTPGSMDAPTIIPVPSGSTHVAILCEGPSGDALISYGGSGVGVFSPAAASSVVAVTGTDQRVALPTLGSGIPAIRLVSMAPSIGALWVKLGNSGVTGSLTTSMKIAPGSVDAPVLIPITASETHLSIFCEGVGGNVTLSGGALSGVAGLNGANGASTGLRWNFDSSTSMADPGTGDFRLNNATLASVTAAAVSDLTGESGSPDASAWVLAWDDSTNSVRGALLIKKIGAEQNFAVYNITGASTDNSGWTQLALTYVTSSGSFSNGDGCVIGFARAGDLPAGKQPDFQRFDATGAWTKPSGFGADAIALIRAWGQGGGGGRGGSGNGGGGGGGGTYSEKWVKLADLGSTETATIGAATNGATVNGTAGTAGTNSTFGAHLTAFGGGGGAGAGIGGDNGGGGGGGALGAGVSATSATGRAGGGPGGGNGADSSVPTAAGDSQFGGGGGGSPASPGGNSAWGGGGGGGGSATNVGSIGGNSFMGGGGGGGGEDTGSGRAGGTSVGAGGGGSGATGTTAGTAGTQPAGGGGGSENANAGNGGAGRIEVTVFDAS